MTTDRDPVSVILPTRDWGSVCEEMAAQLRDGDELLVVCDADTDPVANRETPDGVAVLVAGEPEGCSGKANAMAYAMERADNDRFVWTDDDFEHGDGWLEQLVEAGETHGPSTAIPLFVGGGWWSLFEPWVHFLSSFSFYTGVGLWAGNAWGGGVTFTRSDLDLDQFIDQLRNSLSDDGLLSQHLGEVHPIRSMTEQVRVPGDLRSTKERLVRFNRLTHVHEGMVDGLAVMLVLATVAVLFPLATAGVLTAGMALVYGTMGLRRWTFALALPSLFAAILMPIAGILVPEFEWAGRRYRLKDVGEIEVLS